MNGTRYSLRSALMWAVVPVSVVVLGGCLPIDLELEALLAPQAVGNSALLRDSVLAAAFLGLLS